MQELEIQEIITGIIRQAEENQPTEFHLITTWPEYKYYWEQAESLEIVLKVLQRSAKFLFKSYCKDITTGVTDFNKLLAYKQFLVIRDYYNCEIDTIRNMLIEYHDYLTFGNFISAALFGAEREI